MSGFRTGSDTPDPYLPEEDRKVGVEYRGTLGSCVWKFKEVRCPGRGYCLGGMITQDPGPFEEVVNGSVGPIQDKEEVQSRVYSGGVPLEGPKGSNPV